LTLTNALQKDSGDFVCVVGNAAGFSEANFTLDVFPPEPSFTFPTLDLSHVFIICVGLLGILLVLSVGVLLTFWRRRGLKPPDPLPIPHKPPRLNYDINPGSFVANGYSKPKVDSTDNPDLILETNNSGSYQVRPDPHFFLTLNLFTREKTFASTLVIPFFHVKARSLKENGVSAELEGGLDSTISDSQEIMDWVWRF